MIKTHYINWWMDDELTTICGRSTFKDSFEKGTIKVYEVDCKNCLNKLWKLDLVKG
jgi:hypothetical protein